MCRCHAYSCSGCSLTQSLPSTSPFLPLNPPSCLHCPIWRILTDFLQARALMAYEYGRELNNIIHTVVPCIPVGRALDGCRVPVRGQCNADNNHHDSSRRTWQIASPHHQHQHAARMTTKQAIKCLHLTLARFLFEHTALVQAYPLPPQYLVQTTLCQEQQLSSTYRPVGPRWSCSSAGGEMALLGILIYCWQDAPYKQP